MKKTVQISFSADSKQPDADYEGLEVFYDLQEIRELLLKSNIQPTVQRISLLKYILCEADHPTADEIKIWADKNLGQISQATIYNTLNVFVEAGILRMFKFPHTDKVIYDCNTCDHYHFLDEGSGKLYDVEASQVLLTEQLPENYKVKSFDILFKGELKSQAKT